MRKSEITREDALADAFREILRGRSEMPRRSPDAEDVAQEALLRALSKRDGSSVRDPIRYLFRIMRNLVIDGYRREQREAAVLASMAQAGAALTEPLNPERILLGKEDLHLVLQAIQSLPPRCREAFVLHRFHNLSYAAIARRMGVSTGTVEKHIADAILRITRALQTPEAP